MMSSWAKWRALEPADRRLVLQALALMVALRVGLRLLPFTTVRQYLDRAAGRDGRLLNSAHSRTVQTDRIIWAVRAAGSRMAATTCLVEALVADTMLHRNGYSPSLKIGVRQGRLMSLDAHAWVECDGTPVIGTTAALTEYVVLT